MLPVVPKSTDGVLRQRQCARYGCFESVMGSKSTECISLDILLDIYFPLHISGTDLYVVISYWIAIGPLKRNLIH